MLQWCDRWVRPWRMTMIALLLVVLFVPMERYRPACDVWREIRFEGPMRDVYVDQLTEALTEEAFGHIRIGDEVFVRLVYPFHYFSGPPTWDSLHEFLINMEWRIASNIVHGYGPDDSRVEAPPEPVEPEEKHGGGLIRKSPQEGRTSAGRPSSIFRDDCELIRAASIRIENKQPEGLPHLPD
jgi:hypothetical protein